MTEDFLSAARAHWARYPLMEPQDFCKLAYQSEFGPAHSVEGPDKVLAGLLEERKGAPAGSQEPESIGGGLCRFHITQALSTLSDLPLLARMFTCTTTAIAGTPAGLADKLAQLETLPVPGMTDFLSEYRKQGCPAVHHSETFRNAYHPHYRVVRSDFAGFHPALKVLDRFAREHYAAWLRLSHQGALRDGVTPRERGLRPYLIAIDGRCGSGKTGFASIADQLIPGCKHILHMDDFYLPWEARAKNWMDLPAGNMDLERLRAQILTPVLDGEPLTIDPNDVEMLLVEGTYSQHPSIAACYDWKLFLTCEKDEQTRRLQVREGDYYPEFDRLWRTLEERYFTACQTASNANLILDTTHFF